MEDNKHLPDTMFGFHAGLSSEDVLLPIKEKILSNICHNGEHGFLAIDIKRVFDSISHRGILEGLANTNCGEKTYNYVQSVLSIAWQS